MMIAVAGLSLILSHILLLVMTVFAWLHTALLSIVVVGKRSPRTLSAALSKGRKALHGRVLVEFAVVAVVIGLSLSGRIQRGLKGLSRSIAQWKERGGG
jgi:hypothetical protein